MVRTALFSFNLEVRKEFLDFSRPELFKNASAGIRTQTAGLEGQNHSH